MNEKIGLPDLTRAIAKDCGLDTKVCDTFLRALFATIGQTLVAGESVKVKGIGTFKSTDVEQRKSVNVNTGQEMLIPGHRKVSFTPDKALAEAVNSPFAMFEPVELADDMTEQMLAEAEAATEPETKEKTTAVPQQQPPATEPPAEVVVAEPALETATETKTEAEPVPESKPEPNPETVPTPELRPAAEPHPDPESMQEPKPISGTPADSTVADPLKAKPETALPAKGYTGEPYIYEPEIVYHHRSHFGKGFIIGMLCTAAVVACVLLAWRFISPASLARVTESFTGSTTTQSTQSTPPAAPATAAAIANNNAGHRTGETAQPPIAPVNEGEAADVPTTPSDQQASASAQDTQTQAKSQSAKAEKTLPKAYSDKITKRRYLTTMAREYYGNYHLWPYIYDYNKGLGHPDRIRPGTKIQVPTPETLGIDPTDPATIRKAKERGREIYKRYRK